MDSIGEMNSMILECNIKKEISRLNIYTPPIELLSVKKSYLDVMRKIRKIINGEYSKIPEEQYEVVFEWIDNELGKGELKETNDELAKYMDDDIKEYLFQAKKDKMRKFWKNETLKDTIIGEDRDDEIFVTPRLNGVDCPSLNFEELFKIIESGNI